jgi:plasmid rolling circle replication initiator protein Rep
MISKNPALLQEQNFQNHKLMNNDIIIKLSECRFSKESEMVRNCGSFLTFSKQEHMQTLETRLKLKKADFCKFRFCATCNWRRNMNINRELLEAFKAIEDTKKRVVYLFLTLTVKNPATNDLKATVELMNDAFKRMSKTLAYKNTILGHFKALEIVGDETQPNEVHPHFHVILIVAESYFKSPKYIHTDEWSKMWQKALRADYSPIVHVQKIKRKRTPSGKKLTALQCAVYEVAKYSVKHSILTDKSNDEFASIILQTKGMRFFSTGGILKEKINLLKCDEELINFKAETDSLWKEIEELIYEWKNGNYILK